MERQMLSPYCYETQLECYLDNDIKRFYIPIEVISTPREFTIRFNLEIDIEPEFKSSVYGTIPKHFDCHVGYNDGLTCEECEYLDNGDGHDLKRIDEQILHLAVIRKIASKVIKRLIPIFKKRGISYVETEEYD